MPVVAGEGRRLRTDEAEFGALVFRCPITLDDLDSGIEMDRNTFRQIRGSDVLVRCRSCRQLHQFKVAAGALAPDGRRSARIASMSNRQS